MTRVAARTLLCLVLAGALLLALVPHGGAARAGELPATGANKLPVYLFWSAGCPHCRKARTYLQVLAVREPDVVLRSFEVGTTPAYDRAFVALSEAHGIEPAVVPLIVVGTSAFAGYDGDLTTGSILERAISQCMAVGCTDVVAQVLAGEAAPRPKAESEPRAGALSVPKSVTLPLLGEVETRTLSLPVLTIVLAFVDGFNPCAMWVLVFLIGLLVGMKDPVRMWTYGAVFLLTSALVYLAFMTAWLNVLMVLGSLAYVRIGIGAFAIAAGGYYLWQFWRNPEAACPVTSSGERQRVMTRLREAVAERSFLAAIAGIVVLAALVNLIELLCSAGVPAVYTQVLALSDLSAPAYAGYMLLYITVFLIDDLVVFVTAMLTLRATGLAATYARYSHLLGGVVLGAVGLMLLFRPEWLVFA